MKRIPAVIAALLLATSTHAREIPAVLPHPDSIPPATDKPVKVYILSGQSNMVGFGKVKGTSPVYPSIILSADPSILPGRIPVERNKSALLPHRIYQDEAGTTPGAIARIYAGNPDPSAGLAGLQPVKETTVPLGTVSAELPTVDGPHAVVVRALIEVPITGLYEMHAGYGSSEQAIVRLAGRVVYEKTSDAKATITKTAMDEGRRYPITIDFLRGGSAAFWMKLVDIKGRGDIETLITTRGKFKCLKDDAGDWTVRNDVILNESYLDENKFKGGRRTPLSATANGTYIGPELGFGYVMGTFHDEPVLLIKADIGNRSLAWDCLPPGSERYEVDGIVYAGYGDPKSSWPKGTQPERGSWYAGKQYDDYTKAVRGVLDNFDTLYPQYKDQGYEIAGFVWWQGHKDGGKDEHIKRYETNMANFIKAWRKEFNAPDAKWVIGTVAFGGWDGMEDKYKKIAAAQLAVSGDSGRHPEFQGNVKTVETRDFWRTTAESPTGVGYHYNHNAETYMLVGDALGRAMVELQGGRAEQRPREPRPRLRPLKASDEMTLAEAAQFIHTDGIISTRGKSDARPTQEQYAEMAPALRPIILGSLLPDFVAMAPKIPAYRRGGMSIIPMITGTAPEREARRKPSFRTQLDHIIDYYNAAGIHDYDWKPFGPDMKNASWSYSSFDPDSKPADKTLTRYRDIDYPEGMDQWFAPDFDAEGAGWKVGAAPFGQKDGKLEPLSSGCRNPLCGCGTTPRTLWEKEVLLIRQTFEIPELKEGHRYRLVLGGSAHAWSGEGYAIYVNGKLFHQETSGQFKGKGGARGWYVFEDFMPEFRTGKVTIAVKSFLRMCSLRKRPAPPRGHISIWMEEARLPESVVRNIQQYIDSLQK